MNLKLLLLVTLTLVATLVSAESQRAFTDTGKPVLLHADGTWTFQEITTGSDSFTFRNTKWGMSREAVISAESGKIIKETNDYVAYEGTVAGIDAFIAYYFVGDTLTRGRYIFLEEHSNETDHISDYNEVQSIIMGKYGEPAAEDTIWKNDLYKDDYSEWGFAISIGHLVKITDWESADTKISLALYGNNYKITHMLEYSSVKLESLEDSKQEKEKSKGI